MQEAKTHFGEIEASKRFRLLERGRANKRIIQDLIDGTDMSLLRTSLSLAQNTPFEKTIAAWYYSPDKSKILKSISPKTKANFDQLFASLPPDVRKA
jgi:hypothetical protein